jgi:hypothetical protein
MFDDRTEPKIFGGYGGLKKKLVYFKRDNEKST